MSANSAQQLPNSAPGGHAPGGQTPRPTLNLTQQTNHVPAGFWRRASALFIDGIMISICTYPLLALVTLGLGASNMTEVLEVMGAKSGTPHPTYLLASYAIQFSVMFFYYGWFYKNMGASPGKLALNLSVSRASDGQRLGYARAFFRETVGKFFSAITLTIGYLLAAFRSDKKALHDLLFDTQVMHEKGK